MNILFGCAYTDRLLQRALNGLIGGTTGNVYLIVGDIGSPTGEGLDFINGMAFLERFYSVFVSHFAQLFAALPLVNHSGHQEWEDRFRYDLVH